MPNGRRHSLARIPLRWMIRECFNAKTGIIFDAHMLKHQVGLDIDSDTALGAPQPVLSPTDYLTKAEPNSCFFSRRPTTIPELVFKGGPEEELKDALSPIHDKLKKRITFWRVMEWIPCEPSSSLRPFAPMTTSSKSLGRKTPSKSLGRKTPSKSLGRKTSSKSLGRQSPSWMVQMPHGPPRSCRFPPFVVYHRRCAMSLIMLTVSWNRSKGRIVVMKPEVKFGVKLEVKPKVHRSVKTRILARGPDGELYQPKARFIIGDKVRRLERGEWLAEEPEHFEWVD